MQLAEFLVSFWAFGCPSLIMIRPTATVSSVTVDGNLFMGADGEQQRAQGTALGELWYCG